MNLLKSKFIAQYYFIRTSYLFLNDPGRLPEVEEEKRVNEIFETRNGKVWHGFTVSGSGKRGDPGP
jgi:hypothetical protein